jgi:hypothetical protein
MRGEEGNDRLFGDFDDDDFSGGAGFDRLFDEDDVLISEG